LARLKNLDLHGRLVLYVGCTALLWLIWGLAYALTGYWFPWPLAIWPVRRSSATSPGAPIGRGRFAS